MKHVTLINRPLALLISFYSDYESTGKAISVHEQVIARLPVTSEHKYRTDAASRVLYKGLMAALV